MAAKAAKAAPVPVAEPTTDYDFLVEAAGADFPLQAPNESADDFIARLLDAVSNCPEATWDVLPEETQEWFNQATAAANSRANGGDDEIPKLEGFVPLAKAKTKAAPVAAVAQEPPTRGRIKPKAAPVVEEEPEPEPEPEPVPVKAKKGKPVAVAEPPAPVKAVKGAKPAAVEPEPVKKAAFGGKQAAPFTAKPDGVTYQIRLLICKNPDIEIAALKAAISKKFPDVKSSTITTLLGDVKATIRAAKAAGNWAE